LIVAMLLGGARRRLRLTFARCVSLTALLALPLMTPGAMRAQDETTAGPEIAVENMDGVPYNDRLVFSRIQNNPEGPPRYETPITFGVHDLDTLRIHNDGTSALTISALQIANTAAFRLESGPSLPATIAAGAFLDVQVRFISTSGDLKTGTLTIASNDADEPSTVVQLAGFWQSVSEGDQEPQLPELMQLFGYTTTIFGAGQQLYNKGQVTTVGEEVFSPYWQRVNASQPVSVRQLAAYHGNDTGQTETIKWYEEDSATTNGIFTHTPYYGQTVLPPKSGSTTTPAAGSFTPVGRFGFQIGNEWSDPTRNDQSRDRELNCPTTTHCGHHVRFWPVRDRSGAIVPNTYLIGQDYANFNSHVNYDFQDGVYLISNIKPAGSADGGQPTPALARIDVGGIPYIDNTGAAWQSDKGLFSPTTVPSENPANPNDSNSFKIDGTTLDPIYRSYRGKTGADPTSFAIPTRGLTTVNLRLHFAERFWTQAGKRKFDVKAEGNTILDDFDIYAAAGGKNKAVVREFNGIAVSDGTLNLDFQASVDNTSIAAIEVLCPGTCPSGGDTTPPAAPSGLTATASTNGVLLNWNENSEGDLKSYNVYRSVSGAGFTKIATVNKPTSEYLDASAPINVPLAYYVKAVDTSNNESAASNQATATRLPDTTPPAAPSNLSATGGSSGIALNWSDNSEGDLAGYNVYRSESGAAGTFAKINTTLIAKPTSQYSDTSVPEVVTFFYYVTAVDANGNESAPSATKSAARSNTTPPAAPLELSALANASGIALDWTENTEADLASYEVYRSSSAGGSFSKIATVNKPTSEYLDASAPRGQVSYYQVVAVDTAGNKSSPATANAPRPSLNAPAPPASTGRLIRLQNGAVVLDWGDNSESDLKGYNVYRSVSASGPFTKINAALLTASTFTDSAPPTSESLYYRIVAVDTGNLESAPLAVELERSWAPLVTR
jgi:fibronectin type 3 domain-containing protein